MSKIAIIGAGSFGTALAVALAAQDQQGGRTCVLWGRDAGLMERMTRERENPRYLAGVRLDSRITPTADLADLAGAEAVLIALPAQNLRGFLDAKPVLPPSLLDAPMVLCAKGIEVKTGLLQSQILAEFHPRAQIAVISGPGFASEIAAGLPAALTLGCADAQIGRNLQTLFSGTQLRFYLSDDVIGVQLGGALKNVIALAAGLNAGADLGASAGAALITRGMAELSRLAVALGARRETLAGLSGFGDLVLSCTSAQSRNFQFGESLARTGVFLGEQTFEGVATARACLILAETAGVDIPIITTMAQILERKMDVKQALTVLMARPLRDE
ncbi:MAG: NAD(P)-dependent glycerol-3-phosphate dehydrogenase [Proteobacteria bacterium]|nr:NAD(P)-dependent glycerol-3-phosphate dehydrogenase [Pseudomonadota bacterium]